MSLPLRKSLLIKTWIQIQSHFEWRFVPVFSHQWNEMIGSVSTGTMSTGAQRHCGENFDDFSWFFKTLLNFCTFLNSTQFLLTPSVTLHFSSSFLHAWRFPVAGVRPATIFFHGRCNTLPLSTYSSIFHFQFSIGIFCGRSKRGNEGARLPSCDVAVLVWWRECAYERFYIWSTAQLQSVSLGALRVQGRLHNWHYGLLSWR